VEKEGAVFIANDAKALKIALSNSRLPTILIARNDRKVLLRIIFYRPGCDE